MKAPAPTLIGEVKKEAFQSLRSNPLGSHLIQIGKKPIRPRSIQGVAFLRAGGHDPDLHTGAAGGFHVHAHVSDVQRLIGANAKPLESGRKHVGRRLWPRHVFGTKHDFQ